MLHIKGLAILSAIRILLSGAVSGPLTASKVFLNVVTFRNANSPQTQRSRTAIKAIEIRTAIKAIKYKRAILYHLKRNRIQPDPQQS